MGLALKIRGLNKEFNKKRVLDNLDLDIEENKIYGLIGKNGSGKSTLLKIIACYYLKGSGEVKVFGEEPFENEKILSKMCLVTGKRELPIYLKVQEIFDISSKFYPNWDNDFKEKLIEIFEVQLNKQFSELSDGEKAAVNTIIGLASRAPLTMFDETYSGMDSELRDRLYKIILEDYEKNPRTIIFSTHFLEEVHKIFENLIVLDKGKIIINEEMDAIKEKAFYIKGDIDKIKEIESKLNVLNRESMGNTMALATFQNIDYKFKNDILNRGISIEGIPIQKLFIALISRKK